MNAGLYIHVPFCKSRCIYCDFHSSLKIDTTSFYKSLLYEINYYSNQFKDKIFDTIYLGGGTPTLLDSYQLAQIIKALKSNFNLLENSEISIECNPEDINLDFANSLISSGFTRVSVGIQSFDDEILKFLSRRHNAKKAKESVLLLKAVGFKNISIDLIYGINGLSYETWLKTLSEVLELDVNHISAYILTEHENTALSDAIHSHKVVLPSDDDIFLQYTSLVEILKSNNFFQYEISNFAKRSFNSVHNSKYWKGYTYLGLGPSAHSYYDDRRFFNISNNLMYYNDIEAFIKLRNVELLTELDKYNEFLINNIRLIEGINIEQVSLRFPLYIKHFTKQLDRLNKEYYNIINDKLVLTSKGIFVSDLILQTLFIN